ncbi:MAG TPA: hypothetical protein GX527_06455, partial [Clostridiaceae bacterium]|nr:hypothetical protein [Clostridiaceae bacterium]
MFNIEKTNTISKSSTQDKQEFYNQLNTYLNDLISIETDWLAGISNASALLYLMLPHINWAGFYLYKGKELVYPLPPVFF